MSNTPTILVKKADGSMVKMTMEEFRLYQNSRKQITDNIPKIETVAKTELKRDEKLGNLETEKLVVNDLPMVLNTEALATTAPVKEVFVNEARYVRNANSAKMRNTPTVIPAKAGIQSMSATISGPLVKPGVTNEVNSPEQPVKTKKWSEDDYLSLLENTAPEKEAPVITAPQNKNEQLVETIISNLPFKIGTGLFGRLRSLILSRLKEIRDDEQVLNYATRSPETGGLGLSELVAGDLVNLIKKYLPSKSKLVNKVVKEEAETEIPITATKMAPAKVYFPEREVKKPEVIGKQVVHDVIAPVITLATATVNEEKRSVGPVEEFKFMTLVDFRRLAGKPAQAVEILKEKLVGLKTESYLLYSQALAGWFLSPLYNQYCEVFRRSLNEKKKISDLLLIKNKEELTLEEFEALLDFSRGLNY